MKDHLRGVLDELCNYTDLLFALAVVEFVLLLFSTAGVLLADPESPEFVLWLLNAAGLVVLLSVSATVTIRCFRR